MAEETVTDTKINTEETVMDSKTNEEETVTNTKNNTEETPATDTTKTDDGTEEVKNGNTEEKVNDALTASIIKQIEYYFGDYNLPRDKFLTAELKKDEGWVELSTMMKFARLARLTKDEAVVAAAIKSGSSFIEINSDSTKIRRSPSHPLPELEGDDLKQESLKRTVYCKGFPKDGSVTLDHLLEYFKQFGEYDSVRMRNYVDKKSEVHGFKGSVLVVFKTEEIAKAFIESPPVQYKKIYLIRKWFSDYLEEKTKEIEERKNKKLAKLEKSEDGAAANGKEFEELPRGNFLRATGFAEGTSREDIKSAVFDLTNDCAFVDFKKGDEQAYIRFNEANSNKTILAALNDNLTVKGAKLSLFLVEGEEEDAQLLKANEARRRSHAAGGQHQNGRKRKFGGGRGGFRGRNKRQKRN